MTALLIWAVLTAVWATVTYRLAPRWNSSSVKVSLVVQYLCAATTAVLFIVGGAEVYALAAQPGMLWLLHRALRIAEKRELDRELVRLDQLLGD